MVADIRSDPAEKELCEIARSTVSGNSDEPVVNRSGGTVGGAPAAGYLGAPSRRDRERRRAVRPILIASCVSVITICKK